jgi:hypothetical protein
MNFWVMSIIFGIIQISIWNIFPKSMLKFMFNIPILAIGANAIGSFLIIKVAGTSAFIGSANMAGSVMFALYALYKKGELDEEKNGF